MTHAVYFTLATGGLGAVAAVLVLIGRMAADCPQTAGAARLATLVVTTAFVAIGAGIVTLIGAALPLLAEGAATGLYVALGFALIALGVGFQIAASTLRDILAAARPAAGSPEPRAPQSLPAGSSPGPSPS
ncbi:MAG: hypothetical protein ACFBWO_14260 [Paracoccaceae bacterium]